jgi:hypothetical protein
MSKHQVVVTNNAAEGAIVGVQGAVIGEVTIVVDGQVQGDQK